MDIHSFADQFSTIADRSGYDALIVPDFGLHYGWTSRSEELHGPSGSEVFPLSLTIQMPPVWPGYQPSFLDQWADDDAEERHSKTAWDRLDSLRTDTGLVDLTRLSDLQRIERSLLRELKRDAIRLRPPLESLANVLRVLLFEASVMAPENRVDFGSEITAIWRDAIRGLGSEYFKPVFGTLVSEVVPELAEMQASGVRYLLSERDHVLRHAHRTAVLLISCRLHIEAAMSGDTIAGIRTTRRTQFPEFRDWLMMRLPEVWVDGHSSVSQAANDLLREWDESLGPGSSPDGANGSPDSSRTVERMIKHWLDTK